MIEHLSKVSYQEKEIILIATAHVSETSVTLVRETIAQERPDSVCVELDDARYQTILNPKAWEKTNVSQVVREKKVFLMLAQLMISSYQKRMAKKLGTTVGGEMIQGIESAKLVGANLVLADRNIQTTFLRLWRLLSVREKAKLIVGLVMGDDEEAENITEDDLLKLLEQDMLESVLGEVKEEFPIIGQVLIHERDQYLANKIKNAPGKKIIAVLGGAHVPGVIQEIQREQDMAGISTIPAKKSYGKWIGWAIPIVIMGLIAYGFTRGAEEGMQNVLSWWLWNGGLSAALTLLVLGHPISIVVAFAVAPISSLNPTLAAGWFAGLAEAWVRKPKVEDMQNIPEDILSVKGFYRNRFLKVLLVVIMANLGSSIGTFIAGAGILRNIFG